MTMGLIGQDIVGGEWLFSGYEAKVAAYVLVLAALRLVVVSGRQTAATLLFVAAAYVHFFVGGFLFLAAIGPRLPGRPRGVRRGGAAPPRFFVLVCGRAAA